MRKALLPMIASLALCGAATVALIATNASAAQTPKKPVMVAMLTTAGMNNNSAIAPDGAMDDMLDAPGDMGGGMPPPDGKMGERFRARMAQMCKDIYARKVGEMAFLETKLALSPAQTGAFARWKQVNLDSAQRHASECSTRTAQMADKIADRMKARADHKAGERPSPVDRLAREEEMLKTRLADLEAERPALAALYNALTPEQRREFHGGMERPGMGGPMGHPGGRMMGMMHRPPMGGPGMGMGPHGPADAPPPPPPQ
jgi:hypothetical protein